MTKSECVIDIESQGEQIAIILDYKSNSSKDMKRPIYSCEAHILGSSHEYFGYLKHVIRLVNIFKFM